jgi:teichoic acid transport system permease protein
VSAVSDRTAALVAPAADAPPLRGPLARRLAVLLALAQSDLRLRYGRGPTRVLKWLLDPWAATGVYLLLDALVLRRGGHAVGLSVACAVVPFQLVVMSTATALRAVDRRHSIILNMAFDRMLLPVAATVTEGAAFLASLTLIPVLMGVYGIAPGVSILWTPLLLVLLVLFSVSLAFPAALFGLWFYSARSFAVSMLRALFFLAPGLVPLSEIHGRTATLLMASPLTGLFEAFRAVFLYDRAPSPANLGVPFGWSLVLLAAFVPLFRLEHRQLAKIVEIE